MSAREAFVRRIASPSPRFPQPLPHREDAKPVDKFRGVCEYDQGGREPRGSEQGKRGGRFSDPSLTMPGRPGTREICPLTFFDSLQTAQGPKQNVSRTPRVRKEKTPIFGSNMARAEAKGKGSGKRGFWFRERVSIASNPACQYRASVKHGSRVNSAEPRDTNARTPGPLVIRRLDQLSVGLRRDETGRA